MTIPSRFLWTRHLPFNFRLRELAVRTLRFQQGIDSVAGMNGAWRHRAVAGIWAAIALIGITGCQIAAAAELRSLQLYHVHTGDSLTITYKRDGQYIPSAMAQLDYFLRDWRTNGLISMSGETIDLMWELHQELGSKAPIRIICGFRSAETNALLKRIGRHVATRSQHILGRAIDLEFPDVPLERLRNSALVRQAGGVGYYPGRKGGFVHIDLGMCGTGRGSARQGSPRSLPNIPGRSATRRGSWRAMRSQPRRFRRRRDRSRAEAFLDRRSKAKIAERWMSIGPTPERPVVVPIPLADQPIR